MKGASLTSRTAGWEPGAPGADTNRKDAPWATEGLATSFLRRWGVAGQWAAWGSWETSSTHSRSFSHTSSCPSEPGGFHCGDSQTQQHLTSRGKGRGKKLKMSTGIRWMCPPRDEASPFFPASRCLPSTRCLSSLGQGRKWTLFLLEKLSNLWGKACRTWHLGSLPNTRGDCYPPASRSQPDSFQSLIMRYLRKISNTEFRASGYKKESKKARNLRE